jgi:Cu(I)/Ag(I) efflux system membrane fusion protein
MSTSRSRCPAALTVPADAVLNTELRSTVFVDRGNGYFEPRRVETGWRVRDRIQILKRLMPGERIVVAGNFFLDSESRMKAPAAGVLTTARKPSTRTPRSTRRGRPEKGVRHN